MIDMGYRVADNNAISGTASCGGKAVKVSYSEHKFQTIFFRNGTRDM